MVGIGEEQLVSLCAGGNGPLRMSNDAICDHSNQIIKHVGNRGICKSSKHCIKDVMNSHLICHSARDTKVDSPFSSTGHTKATETRQTQSTA